MLKNKVLAGIAALACAAAAHANPLPLSATVNVDNHLHTAQWDTVSVNVNSLLAGLGLGSQAIGSGSITVTGHSNGVFFYTGSQDDSEYAQFGTSTHSDALACIIKRNCTVTDKHSSKDVTHKYVDNVVDTMWVAVGDSTGSDSTDWRQSITGYSDSEYTHRTGSSLNGYHYRYQREREQLAGYSGALSVTLDLDAAALGDLTADGILGMTIWSWWGQFTIDDVTLDFTVEQRTGGGANEVPLPGSLLLTGLGLAALGGVRRRRR